MKKILILIGLLTFNFGFCQKKFDRIDAEKFQKKINSEYADAKTSPLMEADLKTFKTLDFYPLNSKYFVNAKFVKAKDEKFLK